jgi:hypothetical protein
VKEEAVDFFFDLEERGCVFFRNVSELKGTMRRHIPEDGILRQYENVRKGKDKM